MSETPHRTMLDRMLGAARLDVATFTEVEHDTTLTGQAAGVVVIVALAKAIGAVDVGIGSAVGAAVVSLVGWLIWAGVTYLIGDKVFGGTATWGELLRALGFAQAPGVLMVLAFLPLAGLLTFVVGVWTLAAGLVAIREALDISTLKALGTAILGWLALVIPLVLLEMVGPG
ncbi:MAG: YIP1 family protein [Gemmatimonadota bacterium]|nr:YIP1 family protein [Gemmatimonadota bacterium]